MKVLVIVGTRPEAVKMAPVVHAFRGVGSATDVILCSTGQHREILSETLTLFDLAPDVHFDVMRAGQSLAELTSRLLASLDTVLEDLRPDWILVQGDTTTAMSAALAAFYRHIKIGHVEAGLRTGNPMHPFPEEINRCIADVVADRLFAPTERSRENLLRLGFSSDRILVTGNTIIDAMRMASRRPYDWLSGPLAVIPQDRPLVVVTTHRRENLGGPLEGVCKAVAALASSFAGKDVQFVWLLHPNPGVRGTIARLLPRRSNLHLLDPLDYCSFLQLVKRATLVLTDSGGVQEEAPAFRVPVLVLREVTERPEGIEAGVARLVGTDRARIIEEASRLLESPAARLAMTTASELYGDGRAAQRIASAIAGTTLEGMSVAPSPFAAAQNASGRAARRRGAIRNEQGDGR